MSVKIENKMDFLHYHLIRKTNFLKWLWRAKIANRKKPITKTIQGSKMLLNPSDGGICYDLIIDSIREPNSTAFVKTIVKNGDIVFDLGANIGYYVLMESLKNIKGKILAIEPEIGNFEMLKKNVALNKRKNVLFMNAAVGDKNGIAQMNVSKHSNMHTLYKNEESPAYKYNRIIGTRNVNLVTVDSLCKKYKMQPNFLRMDVQGYEYYIIKGMKNTLKQKNPLTMFIEFHPQMMKKEHSMGMLKMLKDNGFEIIKMFRDYNMAMMKFRDDVEWDYNIKQLMNDKEIISGKKGTFEIFFSNMK